MRFRRTRYYGGYGDVRFDATRDAILEQISEAYRYGLGDMNELLRRIPKLKEVTENLKTFGAGNHDKRTFDGATKEFIETSKWVMQHLSECVKCAKKINAIAKKLW